jgi:hypothetical protein
VRRYDVMSSKIPRTEDYAHDRNSVEVCISRPVATAGIDAVGLSALWNRRILPLVIVHIWLYDDLCFGCVGECSACSIIRKNIFVISETLEE